MNHSFSRYHSKPGWIEVIVGCMFSGKTEELLVQIRRAELAKQRFVLFKPTIDIRYSESDVESHNHNHRNAFPIKKAEEIFQHIDHHTQVVGIDEGQFFDNDLPRVCTLLANAGKRVIIAGLDTNWKGEPFQPIPTLMAIAEVVRKQYAICMVCGEPATKTQRLVADSGEVLLGANESYEARCRTHFDPELSMRMATPASRVKTTEPKTEIESSI